MMAQCQSCGMDHVQLTLNVSELVTERDNALARITELEDRHTPRDTQKGEWPKEGQRVQTWFPYNSECWCYRRYYPASQNDPTMRIARFWLPAPPDPEQVEEPTQ